jgi:uncharacterized membrane protein
MSQGQLTVEDEERPAVEADRERAYGIGRLMAFSDGVFAIAITLLVLNVPVPDMTQAEASSRLPAALLATGPRLLTFALSFFLVGFYWIRHHQLFSQLVDVDVWLLWLNLVVLFLVCLLPFSTGVVGRYSYTVVGAEVYAVNLAAIALSFTALTVSATQRRLVRLPPATVTGLFSRGFMWPLAVVGLVMVLAPISLTAAYVIGATLMAAVSVYTVVPHVIRSAPLAGTSAGKLRFSRVVARATIYAAASMPELFRARFVGPEPTVTGAGNTVDVEYRDVSLRKWRRQSADIALNTSIPWHRRVRLVSCEDRYTRLKPGTRGRVTFVDDLDTVHVAWEDGSMLSGSCPAWTGGSSSTRRRRRLEGRWRGETSLSGLTASPADR